MNANLVDFGILTNPKVQSLVQKCQREGTWVDIYWLFYLLNNYCIGNEVTYALIPQASRFANKDIFINS